MPSAFRLKNGNSGSTTEEVRNHIGAGCQVEFMALDGEMPAGSESNPRLNLEERDASAFLLLVEGRVDALKAAPD